MHLSQKYYCTTEFFTIRVSVRLSDRAEVTQNKINFGCNPQPPDHHSNGLPTELGRNLLLKTFLK